MLMRLANGVPTMTLTRTNWSSSYSMIEVLVPYSYSDWRVDQLPSLVPVGLKMAEEIVDKQTSWRYSN